MITTDDYQRLVQLCHFADEITEARESDLHLRARGQPF